MSRRCFFSVALAFALLACSKKPAECDSLRKIVNASVKAEKLAMSRPSDTPESDAIRWRAIANVHADAAAEAATLTLTVPELRKFSTDYQALCKEWRTAAEDIAKVIAALATGELSGPAFDARMTPILERLHAADEKEGPIVDGLAAFCAK